MEACFQWEEQKNVCEETAPKLTGNERGLPYYAICKRLQELIVQKYKFPRSYSLRLSHLFGKDDPLVKLNAFGKVIPVCEGDIALLDVENAASTIVNCLKYQVATSKNEIMFIQDDHANIGKFYGEIINGNMIRIPNWFIYALACIMQYFIV
eukprot:UN32486